MKSTLTKIYILAGLEGLVFFYAFDKVFLQENGLSLAQIVILELIYMVTVIILEVPTGAISDRWSRKCSLALSGLFSILYILAFAYAETFLLFALGSFLAGVHSAFGTGSGTALLYDALKNNSMSQEYEKYLGRRDAIAAIAFVSASLIGGAVGQRYGLEAAFWISLPSTALFTIVALSLKEPKIERTTKELTHWQHVWSTFRLLSGHKSVSRLVLLLVAAMVPAMMFDEYAQLYFAAIGAGALVLGFLNAAESVFDAGLSSVSYRFGKNRRQKLYLLLLLLFSIGLWSAWLVPGWLGAGLFFAGAMSVYPLYILAIADLNRELPSSFRSTSESFLSLATQLVLIPTAFLFVVVSDQSSVGAGFGMLGVALFLYAAIFGISLIRSAKDT